MGGVNNHFVRSHSMWLHTSMIFGVSLGRSQCAELFRRTATGRSRFPL